MLRRNASELAQLPLMRCGVRSPAGLRDAPGGARRFGRVNVRPPVAAELVLIARACIRRPTTATPPTSDGAGPVLPEEAERPS